MAEPPKNWVRMVKFTLILDCIIFFYGVCSSIPDKYRNVDPRHSQTNLASNHETINSVHFSQVWVVLNNLQNL